MDVFNEEEIALCFNFWPDKSYNAKDDSYHGGKMSKLCLMVLLWCNSDGSEKLMPLLVEKFHNPWCFKVWETFWQIMKQTKKLG